MAAVSNDKLLEVALRIREMREIAGISTEEMAEKIKNGEKYIIRFKSPGREDRKIKHKDVIKGNVDFPENDLDIVIIAIVLLLTLLGGILVKNKLVFVDLLLSLISLGGIKVVYLIHDYITNEYMDIWMLLLLVFVMIFLFLYLSYTLLKNLKTVIIANKYIRKGGNNENKKRS